MQLIVSHYVNLNNFHRNCHPITICIILLNTESSGAVTAFAGINARKSNLEAWAFSSIDTASVLTVQMSDVPQFTWSWLFRSSDAHKVVTTLCPTVFRGIPENRFCNVTAAPDHCLIFCLPCMLMKSILCWREWCNWFVSCWWLDESQFIQSAAKSILATFVHQDTKFPCRIHQGSGIQLGRSIHPDAF